MLTICFRIFTGKRLQEQISVLICSCLFLTNAITLFSQLQLYQIPQVILAAAGGILLADFLSGYVLHAN